MTLPAPSSEPLQNLRADAGRSAQEMFRGAISGRTLALGAAGLGSVGAVVLAPQLLRGEVVAALSGLQDASPAWLWLAAVAFLAALVSSALAWGAATGLADRGEAFARYGAGSLVNSFLPAHAGDAVRLALFAQAASDRRLRTAGKALVGVGASRVVLTLILLMATVWPYALAGVAVVPLLGRAPAWVAISTTARLLAAAAVAASLGVPSPFLAALLVVPAIDLAGLLPLTPGNVGLKSGAVALALQSQGVDVTTALASGIAFHAVETVVGLACGAAGTLYLTRVPVPRWAVGGATAALAAFFGATVFLG